MIHIYKHVGKLKTLLVAFALLGGLFAVPQPATAANPTGCDHSFSRVVVEENDSSLYPTGPGDEVDQMPGGTVLLAIQQTCGGGGIGGSTRFIYVGESGGDSYFVEFAGAVRVREEIIIPNLDNPRNATWNSRQNGGEAVSVGTISNAGSVDDILADAEDSTADDEAEADNRVSCEGGGFSLAWVMCPIIEGVASTVDFAANSLVGPFLEVEPLQTEDADGETDPIYSVWSGFRNVANVALVVVFLIIIFAQAINFGIDAYSVKKALPRLALAAIAIQLSYFLSTVLVDIFNVIGIGIGDFILDAATSSTSLAGGENGAVEINVSGDFSQVFAGSTLGALFATGGIIWVAASGAFAAVSTIALFVLLPVAIAVLLTFFVLIIRQGVIILLIVLAPVAMTMMVLPNTEQWFKRWVDLFTKTLMMFPMIMGLFASSKLFASVLTARLPSSIPDSGPDSTLYVLTILGALIALAAPLFLVPATFKFAGGAMAAIGSFAVNARKRGTAGIQGDSRDPRSLKGGLKRRRRHNIDRGMTGARLRFGDGETGATRQSRLPGRNKEVKTLGSRANAIMNYAAGRTSDVEGRNAGNIEEADKMAGGLIQTGQDDVLFALALGNDKAALEQFDKGGLVDDDGNFTNPQVAGSAARMQSDPYMKRSAAAFVATKIANTERGEAQLETLRTAVQDMPGLSSAEKAGAWGNATHGIKGSNLVARRTKLDGSVDKSAFLQDAAQMSAYHMNQQGPQFWQQLSKLEQDQSLQIPKDAGDSYTPSYEQQNYQQVKRIVASSAQRSGGAMRAASIGADPDSDDHAQVVSGGMGSPAAETAKVEYLVNSGIADSVSNSRSSPPRQTTRSSQPPPAAPTSPRPAGSESTSPDPSASSPQPPRQAPSTSGQTPASSTSPGGIIKPNQNDPNARVDSSDLPK